VQVNDSFSGNPYGAFTGDTYTSSASAGVTDTNPTGTDVGGFEDIADTVNLPPGSSITYTVMAEINVTGLILAGDYSLTNTATFIPPSGVSLTPASNFSATDKDGIGC
jgi:hypothetical protein